MPEAINILISGIDSCHDFLKRLWNRIDSNFNVNSCLFIRKSADNTDIFDDKRVSVVDYGIINQNSYRSCYNMDSLLPLDRWVLEAMAPFFETAVHSLLRNTDQEVYTFDEAKEKYLDHLRFWNHQFLTRKINYVLITSVPHQCHNYIIYSLAKIYKIKIHFFVKSSIVDRNLPLTDLYSEPSELLNEYRSLCRSGESVKLDSDLEEYYQIMRKRNESKEIAIVNDGKTKKELAIMLRDNYYGYFQLKSRWNRNKSHYKRIVLDGILKRDFDAYEKHRAVLQYNHILYKRFKDKKKQYRGRKYYESLTCRDIPQDEKYVVYFLHLTPEATTMPQAGVFADQNLVIELLDYYLAQLGVKLYVKEHYVQTSRPKWFYDRIAKLPNTRLVSTWIDSAELTAKAVAAATCDGSVTQESIINGRPVLVFGTGVFTYAPGVYLCTNGEDILHNVSEILNGISIDQEDVRRFLKAFEKVSVLARTEVSSDFYTLADISEEKSIDALTDFIVRNISNL